MHQCICFCLRRKINAYFPRCSVIYLAISGTSRDIPEFRLSNARIHASPSTSKGIGHQIYPEALWPFPKQPLFSRTNQTHVVLIKQTWICCVFNLNSTGTCPLFPPPHRPILRKAPRHHRHLLGFRNTAATWHAGSTNPHWISIHSNWTSNQNKAKFTQFHWLKDLSILRISNQWCLAAVFGAAPLSTKGESFDLQVL